MASAVSQLIRHLACRTVDTGEEGMGNTRAGTAVHTVPARLSVCDYKLQSHTLY